MAPSNASKATRNWHWSSLLKNPRVVISEILNIKNAAAVAMLCWVAEIPLNLLIIHLRAYTEIDWKAYMQEVSPVLEGQYDYTKLKGDTGPLVYPAGFVYVFEALFRATDKGSNIRAAQYIFMAIYQTLLAAVHWIHLKAGQTPPLALLAMSFCSYRIHSIFVLRLFNDPVAMLCLYLAVILILCDSWAAGVFLFSLAISVKMNVLLFAPAMLLLLWLRHGPVKATGYLALALATQVGLAVPFLKANAKGYLWQAFNFGRVFEFKWTVNWRLLSEATFLSPSFHTALLVGHLCTLAAFAVVWTRPKGGLIKVIQGKVKPGRLDSEYITTVLFSCNLIGMAFSRSLHYQFYVWYYHSLPLLLWATRLPVFLRLCLPLLIEISWNTYPSTVWSSMLLHVCHGILLAGLFWSPLFAASPPGQKRATA